MVCGMRRRIVKTIPFATHGPPHAFNAFIVLAQTELSNAQSIQRGHIVWIYFQGLLKRFSRLGKPNNRPISNSEIDIGCKITGIEVDRLFVSLDSFRVATHCAVNITQNHVRMRVIRI